MATDYRSFIRNEWLNRHGRRPDYSQRAFARDLKVSQSALSEIMSGKRGLSLGRAKSLADRLQLSPSEKALFCAAVEAEHARSAVKKRQAKERLALEFSDSQFKSLEGRPASIMVSSWIYFAVHSVLCIRDQPWLDSEIAAHLGIDVSAVRDALKILQELEIVEPVKGRWRALMEDVKVPGGYSSQAIKNFHQQMLEKAINALYMQGIDKREFVSVILPIDEGQIPWAKKRVELFWKDFVADAKTGSDKNHVYGLCVQFFDLKEISHK